MCTNLRSGLGLLVLLVACAGSASGGQAAKPSYPNMAPMAQYLSPNQADEIALARSAAPPAVSSNAAVLTLGPKGYEKAAQGTNGFVCVVIRSWANNYDSEDFWNPKIRAPHCFNAPAGRSVLPAYLKRTEWVMSGASKSQMHARTQAALAAHEIPVPEVGSIAYMQSKEGYLGDDAGGHWHPHLMFYLPRQTALTEWGANLAGSPIFGDSSGPEPQSLFMVPVPRWSDGTPDTMVH
jgi:hypothetical protein